MNILEYGSSFSSSSTWEIHGAGGWATMVAVLVIILWHLGRLIFSARFRSSSNSTPTSLSASAVNPQFRISEIVGDADLKTLIDNLDEKLNLNERWDNVVDKRNNFVSYNAKCCKPKDGPLKYVSVTVFENCSTEMLRDFYMDSDYRKQWDKMVLEHEQLQVDESNGTEIGRTIKKLPLLTPREYVLAWRLWEGKDKTFYCFIKECEHPLASRQKRYVRVSFFRSGWRIRKVPGRNACEIKMVHQEDAGLNVEMAKLAFAKGIWSYVCKMDNALRKYSAIHNSQQGSAVSAITLIQKVPPGLETINSRESSSHLETSAASGQGNKRKFSRRPSKKLVANGLLLLGVFCLSRGHPPLGANVAMAYILKKLTKRGATPSQSGQS
ncbi:hypothetical protein VitviT2T_014460 [Vitis vinifera]|uniref:START domain-containing protein n=2 Tax=Vitis vinifera TaxID=29760 RepID=A0ABY9CKV4_VITVI|nr:uncharacterized protein LOC104880411 isoform X1 [Vitis vinifera]WJZ95714.1 hypothetical protein VitviT2T_014460 [Vitis vinifera]|eukprot:XP_010655237.1 PREDICTED: stAR-related lipid transfer protein 7, mitochondrial isoform X1 [Vitis vinifera]